MAKRRATVSPVLAGGRRSGRTTAVAGDCRYNMSYHPADKVLRPANARKALGKSSKLHDEASESDKENMSQLDTDADAETESDEVKPDAARSKRLKQPLYSKPERDPKATRRSKRSEARKPVLYNAKVHPLDAHYRKASRGESPEPSTTVHQTSKQDKASTADGEIGEDEIVKQDADAGDSETASEAESDLSLVPDDDNIDNEGEDEQEITDQPLDASNLSEHPSVEASSRSSRIVTSSRQQKGSKFEAAADDFMSEDSGPDEVPSQIMHSTSKVTGWRGSDGHVAISKSDPRLQGFRTVDDSILDEHAETIERMSDFLNADTTYPPQGSIEY